MEFGIKKCAVQPIYNKSNSKKEREAQLQKIREGIGKTFRIDNQQLPIAEKYTHLGSIVNTNLTGTDTKQMRTQKARARLGALRPFLHSNDTIAQWRTTVVQATIPASLLYGSELWFFQWKDIKKMQSVYNNAVKSARRWGRGSATHPLMLESAVMHL